MYIRKTKRQYKKKTYNNYLLVESIHTSKGPRQKTICSLGDLSPRPAKDWLKIAHKIEDSLMGHSELFEEQDSEIKGIIEKVQQRQAARKDKEEDIGDIVSVYVDGVETEYHREAGSVHVGYQFWKKFEMHKILKQAGLSERAGVLTCAMTLNRLICPLSEHAMPNWMRSAAVDDIMGVDFKKLADDALYRNLDKLYPNRALIESALVERERSIFTLSPTIFFYDITSTYFEGEANGNEKAARGYSRDNRSDCKQVLIGLPIGREGFPLAHEVMKGNLQDRQTLEHMLDVMDERVGLTEGQTIVIDRGMAYDENIEQIRRRKLHYIIRRNRKH